MNNAFLIPPTHAACSVHFILLHLNIPATTYEEYVWLLPSSSLYCSLCPTVTRSLLVETFSSALCSRTVYILPFG